MAGLVKAKKYDWKDSNMALFGSDTEKQVKPSANVLAATRYIISLCRSRKKLLNQRKHGKALDKRLAYRYGESLNSRY